MNDAAETTSSSSTSLAVIGGGNMGAALLGGLIRAGHDPRGLAVVEVVEARRAELATQYPGVAVTATVGPCAAAIIAVKPYDVAGACRLAAESGARRILSIAAGITIAHLEAAAGPGVAVVRAMPNTPALVGEGASAIAAGSTAQDDDMDWAESVLRAVGVVVRVPESQLDAVTGLAGSGPAYLFLVAEALMDAGVAAGLPRATSEALVRQLLVGSAALLADGAAPADLRAGVTSPGGTTAAGVRVLEERATRAALIDAVIAATERSRALGAG